MKKLNEVIQMGLIAELNQFNGSFKQVKTTNRLS